MVLSQNESTPSRKRKKSRKQVGEEKRGTRYISVILL